MDRVRLGRVLGRGARLAARTAYEAVDAATSPSPATPRSASAAAKTPAAQQRQPQEHRAAQVHHAAATAGRIHGSVQQAKQGILAPVKRASRALTLEITGSFFALFAFSFSLAAWKWHGALRTGVNVSHFWISLAVATVFAYFAVSSFLKARSISRQPSSMRRGGLQGS